ncbi:MAG: hypothetical protein FWB77_01905 [Treponema sp.]|nr:hypothetical protein [Treponema sp.]
MAKTKAGAVKTKAAKKSAEKISEKDSLANELKNLIPKLDEEGLAFLVKQAHVHLYNMQVDALNQNTIREDQRESAKNTKSKKAVKALFTDIEMSDSGSGYHILFGNEWISFTKGEITTMVKIALCDDSDLEIRGRFYNWLSGERSDILVTASIADKFDKKLNSLLILLRNNFKIKK